MDNGGKKNNRIGSHVAADLLLVVGGNRRKSESWIASLRSLPRLRATLSIATCFVLASSAGLFSCALRRVLVAIAVWSPSAATSDLSRTSRKAWKSLKGDRPAGPRHGRCVSLLVRNQPAGAAKAA